MNCVQQENYDIRLSKLPTGRYDLRIKMRPKNNIEARLSAEERFSAPTPTTS